MNSILLHTIINAPLERCFELSTSIDLHKISASKTKEKAIAGRTQGLIKLNETVTWKAKHLGIWHIMKVKITAYEKPNYFVDEMLEGSFKSMKHTHKFENIEEGTLMTDRFEFSSPFGILGRMADKLFLVNYMRKFIEERNRVIKAFAESDDWKQVLK